MRFAALVVVSLFAALANADVVETYCGASSGMYLPGNGVGLKRAALTSLRAGAYLSEDFAIEGEGYVLPSAVSDRGGSETLVGGSVQGVWHGLWNFIGYERLSPFVLFGVKCDGGADAVYGNGSHRIGTGPIAGLGAFWHLTDRWSVRAEGRAAMSVDCDCGMAYSLTIGLQRSFGDVE